VFSTFIVTDFLFGKMRGPFFSEIYESVQSVFLGPAVLSACAPAQAHVQGDAQGDRHEGEQLNSLSLVFFALLVPELRRRGIRASRASGRRPEFRDRDLGERSIWGRPTTSTSPRSPLGALWENAP
jgi:hypothetical protein